MRIKAVARRILLQMKGDRRTVALIIGAPIIMMTLIFFVLNSDAQNVNIAVINAPESYVDALYENNARVTRMDEAGALVALENQEIVAAVSMENGKYSYVVDGSNSVKSKKALAALEGSRAQNTGKVRADLNSEIEYIYGASDLEMFDNYGAALLGFVIFFFVFLIAGINFLTERTSGTLEKMLSTPIRRSEIVLGYICGYGVIAIVQTVLITFYLVYVLKIIMIGSIWSVMIITLATSICALTLGMMLSSLAENEFQIVQFIPIVIIPQIFFCGIFELSEAWDTVGYAFPLKYSADALSRVMIRGAGMDINVLLDLSVLIAFSAIFVLMNIKILKKHRAI
ncbi:MAG: ABC transporter permease [Eubacteriales bacterium]|nr:ABC transporter permease [Eubacteriales bacterium]MDD4389789.1 ABC transporter permease [Eubacteriales bacterium]